MSHAEIPPPHFEPSEIPTEEASARSLDEVGVENVLASMIEGRRRASRPAPCELGLDYMKAR